MSRYSNCKVWTWQALQWSEGFLLTRPADPYLRTGETTYFRDRDSSSPIIDLLPVPPVTVLDSQPKSRTHGAQYTTDDR